MATVNGKRGGGKGNALGATFIKGVSSGLQNDELGEREWGLRKRGEGGQVSMPS